MFRQMRMLVCFVLAAIGMSACASDLIVKNIEATGPAIVNSQGSAEVPIRVVVRNQGDGAAGVFKVSTEYSEPTGASYAVAFAVPGQSNMWYPYTSAPLAAGSEVTFSGKVIFYPKLHGVTVNLKAIADSCSGDEFMPSYCRVNEKDNEGNNVSAPITVVLP